MSSTLVCNGSVDYHGRIADKKSTGGWKAAPFIIVNEVAERLAFYAIAVNMVTFLVVEMHESIPNAATHVTDWIGAAYVLTILGAFVADAYLGRFKTILLFSCVYAMGMVLLTLSASVDSLRPPACTSRPCPKPTTAQTTLLYGALALIALGTGGIKPCVSSFGADQFDDSDEKEVVKKYAFFNWFFFAINMGALLAITLLVYLQEKKGWRWGFGVPAGAMVASILVIAGGFVYYRHQRPTGSPFTRFLQVIVAALRNHFRGGGRVGRLYEVDSSESDIVGARKLPHTLQYKFLDKAAMVIDHELKTKSRWKLCTVTQVEEFKCFIRILPVWASTIAISLSFAQQSTFFLAQARVMDRSLGPTFSIPAGSISVFAAINGLILIPLYERLIVPSLRRLTANPRGLTSLQRMGVGLFISIFAFLAAALVERARRAHAAPSSVFWLLPQFFMMGSAEVFTYVGQLEFFYDESTDGTRSVSSAVFLSEVGIGSWLSTALVKTVVGATGGAEGGWLRNDLNASRLDYYYWVVMGVNVVNFVVYVWVAMRYKGRTAAGKGGVADVGMMEVGGHQQNKV